MAKKTSKKVVRKTVTKAGGAKKPRATTRTAPAAAGQAHILNEGMAAPAFRLSRDDGGSVSLKDFAGR